MAEPLVLECSEQVNTLLTAFVSTGLFGPSRETAAQRLLELKIFELAERWLTITPAKQ